MKAKRIAVALLAAIVLSGCSNSSTGPNDQLVGVWKLRTWDGKTLPAVTYGTAAGFNEQLVSEEITVTQGGTFSIIRTIKWMPENRTEVQKGSSGWTKTTAGYSFGDGLVAGTMAGGELTIGWRGDGKTFWVYGR